MSTPCIISPNWDDGTLNASLATSLAAHSTAKQIIGIMAPGTVISSSADTMVVAKNLRDDEQEEEQQQQLKICASFVNAAAAASVVHATPASSGDNANGISDIETVKTVGPFSTSEAADVVASSPSSGSACGPTLHHFTVHLERELGMHEHVGLTGEPEALGGWRLENCVKLTANDETGSDNNDRRTWSASVVMPCCDEKKYRYFIYTEDDQGRKQVRHWETHPRPRSAASKCNAQNMFVDRFGHADALKINRGWLTSETIVHLKFEREHVFQVHNIEEFDPENIYIKDFVTNQADFPVEQFKSFSKNCCKISDSGVHVEVAKLNYGNSKLQEQEETGILYKRNDIILFHVTLPITSDYYHHLMFYNFDGKLIGYVTISPDLLKDSEGELKLNVLSPDTGKPKNIVAELTLPYLIIRPYSDAKSLDFRTSYAHYWPKNWPNLDVGHRGNGRSYIPEPPTDPENTLASFLRAYEHHADMVELDVHLTADGVAIVYHDFGFRTAPQGKQISSPDQLEYVLIKDLPYDTIKDMRLFSVINNKVIEFPSHNAETRVEHRVFPRLRDIFENLPKTLGIDVEIKWPQRKKCGGVEAVQTIDKNYFVDKVLQIVLKYGCDRPIIFSSFDADICAMFRFKQNIFPVIFLTMGETKKWEPFMDLRTRTFLQAINTAEALELAGTAPHAEDFINENGAELMRKALERDQITLVWGDDCNSKERVLYFKEIGATATCYDRTDLHINDGKKRAFFNSATLIAEFEAQCRVRDKQDQDD